MSSALLALAMLAQPETSAGRTQLHRIARTIIPIAQKYELDPALLAAVALAESGGRDLVAYKRGRRRRGADVGVFQIHCPMARPSCVQRYRDLRRSAAEAALRLTEGRERCKAPRPRWERVCARGYWAPYNPGSRRWAARVQAIWTRIRAHLQLNERQPAGV